MDQRPPSPFEAILRQLRSGEAEDGPPRQPVASTPWFVAGTAPHAGAELARDHYGETAGDGPGPAEQIVPAVALASVAVEDIRRELRLGGCRSVESLKARRREFARDNHPDRLGPEARDNATERMMIANRLIDAEIARLRATGGG